MIRLPLRERKKKAAGLAACERCSYNLHSDPVQLRCDLREILAEIQRQYSDAATVHLIRLIWLYCFVRARIKQEAGHFKNGYIFET